MFIFVVSTVPADGLAPDGARSSAGTVMKQFESYTSMQLAYEMLEWALNRSSDYVIFQLFISNSVRWLLGSIVYRAFVSIVMFTMIYTEYRYKKWWIWPNDISILRNPRFLSNIIELDFIWRD